MTAPMSVEQARERWAATFTNQQLDNNDARRACEDFLQVPELPLLYRVKCHLMLGGLGYDAPVAQHHFNKAKEFFEELSKNEQDGQDEEEINTYGMMIEEALEALKPEMRAWKIEHDIEVSSSEAERNDSDDDAGNPPLNEARRNDDNSTDNATNRSQQAANANGTTESNASE